MEKPDQDELDILRGLLLTSTVEKEFHDEILEQIDKIDNYEDYQAAMYRFEELQPSIHEIQNPLQKHISKHIKSLTWTPSN